MARSLTQADAPTPYLQGVIWALSVHDSTEMVPRRTIGRNSRSTYHRTMPNRLAGETSPYLLQHANNPVDWFPWGGDALARAKLLDRPIFLSIGYAACHWCHVMERESFEDEATARLLNEHFVAIKVDREERPDLDSIYMSAVQAMTGSGGWPMSVFLTPDGAPFYGGTYFPDRPRHGMPSFSQVLEGVSKAWTMERGEALAASQRLVSALVEQNRTAEPGTGPAIDRGLFEAVYDALMSSFDTRNGSWGGAPKFPQPMTIEFLLRRIALGDVRTRRDRPLHARQDGRRRHPRPARWRLPPLCDRPALARAALRADALRQRPARARVPARLGDARRGALRPLSRDRDRRARLHDPRADDARRRLRLQPGRRHRRHRRPHVHLARARDPRGAGAGGGRPVRRGVRRDRRGQLGGRDDPLAHLAGRRRAAVP